jgi:hypothetical protein
LLRGGSFAEAPADDETQSALVYPVAASVMRFLLALAVRRD